MKTLETIAQECAQRCLSNGLGFDNLGTKANYSALVPIIAAAIREATEQKDREIVQLKNALDMGQENCDTVYDDLKAQLGAHKVSLSACRSARTELTAERDRLAAEVEHIKAWANAKVEELDHYKRVFKSNGRSMELMAARIPTGHDVIDAVIEASAVSADSPGVLVWSANAPEQIEAALARIAAALREATEPLKLELASETARANALRDDVFRLREELHDANTTLGQMRISEDAWLVERDALRGEVARLGADVERLNELSDNQASALKWAHDELAEIRSNAGPGEPLSEVVAILKDGYTLEHNRNDQLRATLDEAEGAGKALIARLEATHGQAFYDVVKPELIALEVALARIAATKNQP